MFWCKVLYSLLRYHQVEHCCTVHSLRHRSITSMTRPVSRSTYAKLEALITLWYVSASHIYIPVELTTLAHQSLLCFMHLHCCTHKICIIWHTSHSIESPSLCIRGHVYLCINKEGKVGYYRLTFIEHSFTCTDPFNLDHNLGGGITNRSKLPVLSAYIHSVPHVHTYIYTRVKMLVGEMKKCAVYICARQEGMVTATVIVTP